MSSPVPAPTRPEHSSSSGRSSGSSRLAHIMVGVAWLALGLAKVPTLADAGVDTPRLELTPFIVTGLELVLAVFVLLPTAQRRVKRPACLASMFFATALLGLTWAMPTPEACGCFGVLGRAEQWQRTVASAAILYLSLEWWPDIGGHRDA